MADVRTCLRRVEGLKRSDTDNVFTRIDELVNSGVAVQRAQVQAVQQAIADLRSEKLTIAKAAVEGSPETFQEPAKPAQERPPEPKVLSTGRILGAPTEAPTEKDRKKIIKRMVEVMEHSFAMAEQSWDWYERAGSLIRQLSRGDPALMERMTRMYAIASKGAAVGANQRFVINALHREALGLPMQFGKTPNSLKPVLKKLLDPSVRFDEDLKGEHVSDKVINFYRNLHDAAFEEDTYANALTLDRWMMRSAGFDYRSDDNTSGRKGRANLSDAQYVYLHDLMLRVTDDYNKKHNTNFLPRHVQSLIWAYERNKSSYDEYLQNAEAAMTAIRAYRGGETKRTMKASERVIIKAQERLARFKSVENEQKYIDQQIKKAESFRPTNLSFLEDFSRVSATITAQSVPGASFGDFNTFFQKATFEQKLRFEMIARELVRDADGNDMILKKLSSSPAYSWIDSFGGVAGGTIPTHGVMIPLPRDAKSPSQTRLADAYAAMWGYIFHQDSVAWHMKPEPGMRKENTVHTVVLEFPHNVTSLLGGAIYDHVWKDKTLREAGVGYTSVGNKMMFSNHSTMKDSEFTGAIEKAVGSFKMEIEGLEGQVPVSLYETRLYSKIISKDDDNGNGYIRHFEEAGIGTDAARWADSARAAYEGIAREFVAAERQGTARTRAAEGSESGAVREQGVVPAGDGGVQGAIREGAGARGLEGFDSTRHIPGIGQVTFGPADWIVALAKEHGQSIGKEFAPQPYVHPDGASMQAIAKAYDDLDSATTDPKVWDAWQQLARESVLQYQLLKKQLSVELIVLDEDHPMPYAGVDEMILDVVNNRHLYIFQSPEDNSALGAWSGERDINGRPLRVADLFNITHAVFGHAMYGVGYRADGDLNAWRIHSAMMSDQAAMAAATEIVGQSAYVHYGQGAEAPYRAPTKIGFLPADLLKKSATTRLSSDIIVREGGSKEDERAVEEAKAAWKRAGFEGAFGELRVVTPLFKETPLAQDVRGRVADAMLAEKTAEMFGKKIVWYHSDERATDGFYIRDVPDLKNTVFLNAASKSAFSRLFGHELLHSIANTDPALYSVIRYAVRGYLKNHKEYAARATFLSWDEAVDKPMVEEEMIADVLGDLMTDPQFWKDLQAHAPGKFDAFVQKAVAILSSIWKYLTSGFRKQQFESLNPSDLVIYSSGKLNAIRSAMAQGLSAYYKRMGMTEAQKRYSLPPAFKIDLLHGSWHPDIAKFLLDFVNSGEGAQVYSWGIYLTSLNDIANWYANTVGRKRGSWKLMYKGNVISPFSDASFYDAVTVLMQNAKVFGEVTQDDISKFMATAAQSANNGDILEGSIGTLEELLDFTDTELRHMAPMSLQVMSDEELAWTLADEDERAAMQKPTKNENEDAWMNVIYAFEEWSRTASKHAAIGYEGTIYKVEVDADPEHFLFWDEADQPKYVADRVFADIRAMIKNQAPLRDNAMRLIDRLYRTVYAELVSEYASTTNSVTKEAIREAREEINEARERAGKIYGSSTPDSLKQLGFIIAAISRHAMNVDSAILQYGEWVQEGLGVAYNMTTKGKHHLTPSQLTGEQIYHLYVAAKPTEKDASLYLRSLGVAGMRYYDGVSRYDKKNSRTYNYVLYNDDLIKIVGKETKTFSLRAKKSVAAKKVVEQSTAAMNHGAGMVSDGMRQAVEIAKGKSIDSLPMALALLGRRQIVDIYGDLIPGMRAWSERIQHMDAEKNGVAHDADKIVVRWGRLPQKVADDLADLMHDSTIAQVEGDPDNYKAGTNFGIWGDKKALARKTDELRARFNSLPAEAKAIYREARDMYRAQWLRSRDAMIERVQRSIMDGREKKAMMDLIKARFEESLRGVYFPLGRYGDYYVTATKKGDESGERAAVVFAESSLQAEEARKRLMRDFPGSDYEVSNVQYRLDRGSMDEGASVGFVSKMYYVVDKQGLDKPTADAMKDAIHQLYLTNLPDVSWAKHGIHRKGTPGYNSDARRNFAANMFHGGFYMARLDNMDILQMNLRDMEEGMRARSADPEYDSVRAGIVFNELLKRQEKLTKVDNHPVSNFLTGLGFVFHMGLVPASALTNLSQTALVAYPLMATEFGHFGAFSELLKASKEIATSINIKDPANFFGLKFGDPDLQAAIERAIKEGVIDLTLAHDLAGVSEGKDSQLNKKWTPLMKAASWLFHQAELFNRLSTFAATYRLATKRGEAPEAAYQTAVKLTYDSHFDYSHSNRARVMSGPVSRVVLLFKQYAQNMLYLLSRNAYLSFKGDKVARKRLANVLAVNALATGAFGLPWIMSGGLMALAEALVGDEDEPWDAEAAIRNYLAEAYGPEVSEAVTRGAYRLLPGFGRADITGRVGLDALMFRNQDIQLQGAEWYHSIADAILGPVAGIALNASKGIGDIAKGDWQRGMEQMVPTVFSGPLKAYRYAKDGVIDRTGVEIMADIDAIDLIIQSAGFTPSRVKERFDARRYVFGIDKAIQERRKDLMRRFSTSYIKADEGMVEEVMRDISLYNERQPDFMITPQQLAASVKTREKRIAEAESGVYLPKPRRGLIELAAFSREEE